MRPPPLQGVRIADFSRVLAGPYCTMVLADLGAEVIKVERPDGGDDTRGWGPPFRGEDATYFLSVNRDKRSIALDLDDPQDRALARRLALSCDVVVENFRAGVMARFELDQASLRAVKPELVYCSITAYGLPELADRPGYDLLMQAASGFMSITGAADGEPTKVGVAVLDVLAGLHAAIGVLGALSARQRDGTGQHVSVGLFDAAVSALVNQAAAHLIGGVVPGQAGNAHPSIVPYQLLPTTDAPIVVAAGNDKLFSLTCIALDLPTLATDQRFRSNADRVANREVLIEQLSAATQSASSAHWIGELERLGVPASLVRSMEQVFDSPEGRHTVVTVDDPVRGQLRLVASPLVLHGTPTRTEHQPPPRLDEHGEAIRSQLAD